MKKTFLTLSLILSSLVMFAQSEGEILNKWINTYNELSTSKNYDAMISNFEACRSELPNWDYAFYYKGLAEYNKQNYASAVKDLTTFTQKNDSIAAAFMMIAQCFNALSQPQDALTYLNTYLQKEPNDKAAYLEMANSHRALNQYDAYIEDLNKVISLDAQNEGAYKNLATAYAMQKNYTEAVTSLSKAIELDGNNADHYYTRATYKLSSKDAELIKTALEDLNKAEELGRNDAKFYNTKYKCCAMLKDNACAIESCNKLLEINPDDLGTLYNRANTYYKDKKYKETIADTDKIIDTADIDDKSKLNALKLRYMSKKALKDVEGSNADLELINKMSGK